MPERWTPHAGFKQRVAKYYGLQGPSGDESKLVDMLGVTRDAKDVTLAHLFPASYDTFGTIASELALPANFHKDCRSFLLLPRELHTVFDSGIIGFIPSRDRIIIRVLKPAATLSPELGVVDGTPLYIPRGASDGHWPHKRTLGWFAWLAKGASAVDRHVQMDLDAALDASLDESGKTALQSLFG